MRSGRQTESKYIYFGRRGGDSCGDKLSIQRRGWICRTCCHGKYVFIIHKGNLYHRLQRKDNSRRIRLWLYDNQWRAGCRQENGAHRLTACHNRNPARQLRGNARGGCSERDIEERGGNSEHKIKKQGRWHWWKRRAHHMVLWSWILILQYGFWLPIWCGAARGKQGKRISLDGESRRRKCDNVECIGNY